MKRVSLLALLLALTMALCAACGSKTDYQTMEINDAAEMIAADDGHLLVDVRTKEEFEEKHLPGAILLPVEDIKDGRLERLPDKDQTILLYCRTGRRAEDAAAYLAKKGYTNIYEIGGIIDWKGETVTGSET